MTITEFLLARIAEDEHEAEQAKGLPKGMRFWSDNPGGAFDPDHVLAECEAKRRIVERHKDCGSGIGYCDDGGHGWSDEPGCADLADLASIYADRPDYRNEWRL